MALKGTKSNKPSINSTGLSDGSSNAASSLDVDGFVAVASSVEGAPDELRSDPVSHDVGTSFVGSCSTCCSFSLSLSLLSSVE